MPEIVVVATLEAKPGSEEAFDEELRKLVPPTHAEEDVCASPCTAWSTTPGGSA